MCAWRVINGVRGVYFALLGGKIWVFALSLPFNLSRRMERLFNSSITRKCPPEHKRRGAKAGEAGCLEPPFPPPHIYQPVKSAGEQRRLDVLHGKTASAVNALNIPAGISRVAGFIVTFVFATVTLIRTSAEPPPPKSCSARSISPASTPTPYAPVSRSFPHHAPHICQTTSTQLSIWLQVATPEAPHFRSSWSSRMSPRLFIPSVVLVGLTRWNRFRRLLRTFPIVFRKGLRGSYLVGLGSRVALTVTQWPKTPQTGAAKSQIMMPELLRTLRANHQTRPIKWFRNLVQL